MGFGQMKREANRDRETFGGVGGERRGGGTRGRGERSEMNEREMEEEQEVEKVWTKGK